MTIKTIIEEWKTKFTEDYGEDFPTRVFVDHDDFLIIKNNTASFFEKKLSTLLDEIEKDVVQITPTHATREYRDTDKMRDYLLPTLNKYRV